MSEPENSSPPVVSSEPTLPVVPPKPNPISVIFWGPTGLRGVWRVIMFFAICAVILAQSASHLDAAPVVPANISTLVSDSSVIVARKIKTLSK